MVAGFGKKTSVILGALALSSLMLPVLWTEPQKSEGNQQVTAALSASNWIVRAGQRTTLILDLELKPNVHVYGSGSKGYIPIDWKMKDSTMGTFDSPVYPKPQTLFLPALNEKAPVYENRVHLTRDMTIHLEPKAATGQFNIEGTLSYQACDDKMCYFPQEMPVKWTLRFENSEKQ